MATTMDIRLDYGAWPGDDGDQTESPTSREASPTFYQSGDTDAIQHDSNARRQLSPPLSLSDLFSDSGDNSHTQDPLHAEMNTLSSASIPPNTPRPTHPSGHGQGINAFNLTEPSVYDSPVIDLTESPPQPLHRPSAIPSHISTPPISEEQNLVMPPTLRSSVLSRRAPPAASSQLASHAEEGPRKRRRLSERSSGTERPPRVTMNAADVEAVDLTAVYDDSDLSKAISKQQQDAVHAQMKDNEGDQRVGRTPLSSYKCPICMDTPEDATSTMCGHLFCHKCIIDTLRFSERQRRDDAGTSKAKGTCPVCRKPLARKDEPGKGRTLVPLEIKLSTRRDLKGKGVVGRTGQSSAIPGRMLAKTERESSADMWRDLTTLDHP